MPTRTKRIQMAPETEKFLKNCAYNLGATFNEEGSISILLQKIAQGEFKIERNTSENLVSHELKSKHLTIIRFSTVLNLRGILSKISNEIHKNRGNIYKVKVKQTNQNFGYVECRVDILPDNLEKLIKNCNNFKLKEIEEFYQKYNNDLIESNILENIESLVKNYDNLRSLKDYQFFITRFPIGHREEVSDRRSLWNKLREEKLFSEISCSFGIRLSVDNNPGKLAIISDIIAKHEISISDIRLSSPKNNFKKTQILILLDLNMSSYNKDQEKKEQEENNKNLEKKGIYSKIEDAINEIKDDKKLKAEKVEELGIPLLEETIFKTELMNSYPSA